MAFLGKKRRFDWRRAAKAARAAAGRGSGKVKKGTAFVADLTTILVAILHLLRL
ncbi:hypothetical protein [Streptomyces sp. SAJ15]|uniref:hypothetical protein n=1 Tax=Streptomyces sp. SAJ15 TaxID=2011095 RepID=UPI0016432163|nr:hypothetical protein [Streptomyces sp. SAJ15]